MFFPEHNTDVKTKKLYKPTSKLAELAATFQSVKEATKQEDNVCYRGRQLYCELLFCSGLISKELNKVVPYILHNVNLFKLNSIIDFICDIKLVYGERMKTP